jgi:hypothetical protein
MGKLYPRNGVLYADYYDRDGDPSASVDEDRGQSRPAPGSETSSCRRPIEVRTKPKS